MRKFLTIICLSLMLISLGACRRASHNGKIDGFWKITEIQYADQLPVADSGLEGTSVVPEDLFICVNLELLQLGNPGTQFTGVMSYSKGDDRLGVDFKDAVSPEKLLIYGFPPSPSVLDIVSLSDKRLVLRSDVATVSCRRF